MSIVLVLIGIVVVLLIVLGMFVGQSIIKSDRQEAEILDLKQQRHEFIKRGQLLNSTEQHCFNLLEEGIKERPLVVLAQVHLASLVTVSDKALDFYETLKDLDKSIDFVIVNRQTFEPLVAIELDGPEHNRNTRKIRDKFLEKIFKDCGIKFMRFPVVELGRKELVIEKIKLYLD